MNGRVEWKISESSIGGVISDPDSWFNETSQRISENLDEKIFVSLASF